MDNTAPMKDPNLSDDENEDRYTMALDDVHTRFILNLPPEELSTSDRLFFQLKQAYWFYDDFYCDREDGTEDKELYRFKNLRSFCQTMFNTSPLLSPQAENFDALWDEFAAYNCSISTYGTILLNKTFDKVVLCQNWNGSSWTFPAGKVNQNEQGIQAGARETYKETGFDSNCRDGPTRSWEKVTWSELRSKNALTYVEEGSSKRRTCYVCHGVPEDFPFEPVARKEVSDVRWFPINVLPKKTFAVLPFISQLRKWIRRNGSSSTTFDGNNKSNSVTPLKGSNSTNIRERKSSSKKSRNNNNSRGRVHEGDAVTESCLAQPGDANGWTEKDMFSINERILGRPITYDGNPHTFSDTMATSDPHKFKVVGGTFMNHDNNGGTRPSSVPRSPVNNVLVPPRTSSSFPPTGDDNALKDVRDLQPFFSEEGETPWGERVDGSIDDGTTKRNDETERQRRRRVRKQRTRKGLAQYSAIKG